MNPSEHRCFLVEDANKFGTDEAIFLYNIRYWTKFNGDKKSKLHLHEGRYWMFNPKREFIVLFPFWSENQLRRIVSNLENEGAILVGRFNKQAYDKTLWYTLADNSSLADLFSGQKRDCGNPDMDVSEPTDGSMQNHEPIPDVTPDLISDVTRTTTRQRDADSNHISKEIEPKKEKKSEEKKTKQVNQTEVNLVEPLTQTEMEEFAQLTILDNKDHGLMADIVDVPVSALSLKRKIALTKLRNKALNFKKIAKLRPVTQVDLQEQEDREHLKIRREQRLALIDSLNVAALVKFGKDNFDFEPGRDSVEAFRSRCKLEVQTQDWSSFCD